MSLSINNTNGITQTYSFKNRTTFLSVNWNEIPHKGMATLSQSEIKQRVKELGVEFSNATSDKERGRIGEEVNNLYNQYVSFVSPDRKSLYAQAMKTIKQQENNGKKQISGVDTTKTLIDFLNEHDGIGSYMKYDKTYPMAGGGAIIASEVTGGGAIFDVSYNGESVLSIHAGCLLGNGVYYTPTAAEQAARREIGRVFDNVRENEKYTNETNNIGINILT